MQDHSWRTAAIVIAGIARDANGLSKEQEKRREDKEEEDRLVELHNLESLDREKKWRDKIK
jgi:hypothetical protein